MPTEIIWEQNTNDVMMIQPSLNAEDATSSPVLMDERNHGSSMLELPSFWVLEDSDFNIFGRDLTAAPDIPILGSCSFL